MHCRKVVVQDRNFKLDILLERITFDYVQEPVCIDVYLIVVIVMLFLGQEVLDILLYHNSEVYHVISVVVRDYAKPLQLINIKVNGYREKVGMNFVMVSGVFIKLINRIGRISDLDVSFVAGFQHILWEILGTLF